MSMYYNKVHCNSQSGRWEARRLTSEPIIHAGLHDSIGVNIQGPSLVKVPDWVKEPLGKYYLYFADHKGAYIRLAYSDSLVGPWQIYEPGALHLSDSCFPTSTLPKPSQLKESQPENVQGILHSLEYERSTPHIASPDVLVDDVNQVIYMYFHGLEQYGVQKTRLATSEDGIRFRADPDILCNTYLRVLPTEDHFVGVVMPGVVYQMKTRKGPFEEGHRVFPTSARHHALLGNRDQVFIFWTEVGDAPEHIKVSVFNINDLDSPEVTHLNALLKPELAWEGSESTIEPSVRSVAYGCVNQLRDPCIYVEDERVYLLYAGGGESAIGIAGIEMGTKPMSREKEIDLEFGAAGSIPLLGRLYIPSKPIGLGIVMVHGGAWTANDRFTPRVMNTHLQGKGMHVFSLDFRCGPQFQHPAASADIAAGIRYFRSCADNYGFDADKLGLIGSSSGGHLILYTALQPNVPKHRTTLVNNEKAAELSAEVQYSIALWPVSNPLARFEYAQKTARGELLRAHQGYFGSRENMHEASIQRVLRSHEFTHLPPVMIVQPGEDMNVPQYMTNDLLAAFKGVGMTPNYLHLPGLPHAFAYEASEDTDSLAEEVWSFIESQTNS